MPESWWEYVQRVSAHAPNKDIAAATQTDASTITRWKQGDNPRAETVVAFARAYGRPPVEALLAAGYLEEEDLTPGTVYIHRAARELPNSELVAEMQRRLTENDERRIDPNTVGDRFPRWEDGPGRTARR